MGKWFGHGPQAPTSIPTAPIDDSAAIAQRQNAANAALADTKARGRASTIVAGATIAQEEQYGVGLLSQQKRRAAGVDMGL